MDVVDWLLDSDPAIRWQVLRDLTDAPASEVAAVRARVEHEGWGARLLALEDPDGRWDGGTLFPADHPPDEPGQPWTTTMHVLQTLQILGLDPACAPARRAVALIGANATWDHDGQRYFDGEVEPCINGRTVEAGAYFGVDVGPIVARLRTERLPDGGWNCEAESGSVRSSFDTTMCVLDGLLEYERATGWSDAVRSARTDGEEYLLERGLFRRLSTGAVVDEAYLDFAFPYYWHYDVLRALDHFRRAGGPRDPRLADAVDLVRAKRQPDGRWLLDRVHPGRVHFPLDDGVGKPSRWNTLRALRVLRWWDEGPTLDESEYWQRLEYRICAEFQGFADEPLRRIWCDGLVPADYDLTATQPCIRGRAWCGLDGQDHWEFTLLVGPDMRSRADLDWAALLPDAGLTGWLSPYPAEKRMVIDPLGGYPE